MSHSKKLSSIFCLLVSLALISPGAASENIRIVQNPDDYSTTCAISTSSAGDVELTVDISALCLKPDSGLNGQFKTADIPDGDKLRSGKLTESGRPELPVLSTLIAIPDLAGVHVTADYGSFEIIENIDIGPAQPFAVESGEPTSQEIAYDAQFYRQNEFFPEQIAEASQPLIMRDLRLVNLSIYPVHFNPALHQLKIYRDISVDITFDGLPDNPKSARRQFLSEAFYPIYKAFVANFDEFLETLTTSEIKRGGILFITPDAGTFTWLDEVTGFANWKRQKGYDVTVATTYDVNPSGHPTQMQIRNYIRDAYETWGNPPEYVYLIGDDDLLLEGGVMMPDYPYNSYPSDHEYSMMEGDDFLPDLIVSRVAVDNTLELNCWIAKTLKYEKYPDISDDPEYWRRAIMVAGGNQTVTCPWTAIWAGQRLLERGFVQVDSVIERDYNDPPDYLITDPITAGVGYVNYRGWSGSSGWWDPSYEINALNQCQNINKPGIMTSIACGTGDFAVNLCFGEQWIRMGTANAPRGGPCFFSTTDHSAHTLWNEAISFGFYGSFLDNDIYHFGATCVASKLHQFRCYPREYSYINQYFHTYNALGDPELEMRLTTPVSLEVDHPSMVELGINNLELSVTDFQGTPIENAYITLILGDIDNEQFYDVARTDPAGLAMLSVPTDQTGAFVLTVTGRDLCPYIDTIIVTQDVGTVAVYSYAIDDDQMDNSNGNDDGLSNPGETIELAVDLKNFGSEVTDQNVTAHLIPRDETKAAVHEGAADFGDIAPGQVAPSPQPFVFTISPDIQDGEELSFELVAIADNHPAPWRSDITIENHAARFFVQNIIIGGDGVIEPGESAAMIVELTNVGSAGAEDIRGILSTADGYAHIEIGEADFGTIDVGESGSNSARPFYLTLDPETFNGRNIPLVLTLGHSNGKSTETRFSIAAGELSTTDPSGPDEYGYYMFDNTDMTYTEHPTYEWTEIYNQSGAVELEMTEDDLRWIELPFAFTYYGDSYDHLTICSNGWVSMDSCRWPGFRNWPLPGPTYTHGMIAGFWDDLWPYGTNDVYTYYDNSGHRFIIEWHNVKTRWDDTQHESFEIILYDPGYHQTITGDAMIEFAYLLVNNGEGGSGRNYATVGWEDYSETRGFTISYSNMLGPGCAALQAERVYRITTNTGRGGIVGVVIVPAPNQAGVRVETAAGQWAESESDGAFSIKDVPPGITNLYFTKAGYFPFTLANVTIAANWITDSQDATLQPCPIPQGLEASQGLGDHINVSWSAADHPDLLGYTIYRSHWNNGIYEAISEVPFNQTGYDDYAVNENTVYWYYVTAEFADERFAVVSLGSNKDYGSTEDIVGVEDPLPLPDRYFIGQNFPNPFNASTTIRYELPEQAQVKLDIYDILGRKVTTIEDGLRPAGYHQVLWQADAVASGVYFYRLQASDYSQTKKMLLIK